MFLQEILRSTETSYADTYSVQLCLDRNVQITRFFLKRKKKPLDHLKESVLTADSRIRQPWRCTANVLTTKPPPLSSPCRLTSTLTHLISREVQVSFKAVPDSTVQIRAAWTSALPFQHPSPGDRRASTGAGCAVVMVDAKQKNLVLRQHSAFFGWRCSREACEL